MSWKNPHPAQPAAPDSTTLREDNGVTTRAPVYPRVPKSKWENMLRLEEIKERNKPAGQNFKA